MPKRKPRKTVDAVRQSVRERAAPASGHSGAPAHAQPGATESAPGEPRVNPSTPVVVGIGASAGGLDAFTQVLKHLPAKPGVALVLVQHLDPRHESILPSLLAKATSLPVREAADGVRLRADEVHVIPPDMDIAITDGHLRLMPRPPGRGPHLPLDLFLTTLAGAQGSRAIAVILSGTGSDGTLGCKAVKAAGGIAIAQEPASAKFDGMPKSAIAGGCVDLVLSPAEIAREISRLAHEPYIQEVQREDVSGAMPTDQGPLQRIFALLRAATRADFSGYKKTTLMRRIRRRMVLQNVETVADYARRLAGDPAEVQALHNDLLINVTSFFRDSDTFDALSRVLPSILRARSETTPVRVWVPGCATGEEAYSIAMCLLETLSDLPRNLPVQLFATDLSEKAIEKARAGVYPENITADVSPERLSRFFVKVDGRYRVSKAVRDLIVFARHDLAQDAPFSRLDLVSCRNVLIYLEPGLQKKVLETFHYALVSSGLLVLGKAETVGASSDLFALEDKQHKVYSKRVGANPPFIDLSATYAEARIQEARPSQVLPKAGRRTDVKSEAERILFDRYVPASVLIDEGGRVLQFHGDTQRFLSHQPGAATLDLITMARRGFAAELRRLIKEAGADGRPQRKEGLRLAPGPRSPRISLEVIPVTGPASSDRCFIVLFEESDQRARTKTAPAVPRGEKAKDRHIAQLEGELQALRHYQHVMQEEQAASYEELQSANEEALSGNEELQSINEELETAQEELQSTNEELETLNEELQNRNSEQKLLNDDLDNFLSSTTLPMLMLGENLVVRRFTPTAATLLSLIPADVGRPLGNLRIGIEVKDLERLALEAIQTVTPAESEVQDRDGRWWRLHVRPYRTSENKVEGAVLVLLDIDVLRRGRDQERDARDLAEAILDTAREPLLILSADLRVRRANRAFLESFGLSPQETEGRAIYELGDRQWDIPVLRTMLEGVLREGRPFEDYFVEHEFPLQGVRSMVVNARRLRQATGHDEMILVAIEDRTEALRAEGERAERVRFEEVARAAEAANQLKDEFVATASHELRGPLNAMVGWVHLLSSGRLDEVTTVRAVAAIGRSVKTQARLVDELLDVTRIMTGKLRLSMSLVELLPIVEAALEAARPGAVAKGITLTLSGSETSETVLGDFDRLQQVVWNLLSNAVKFTPKGGRVDVWMGRRGTHIEVKVSDTGQGIPPSFLPHVFERFRQADSSPSRSQPGLGLGLAIVRHLVELHGGTVTADSPGEGQGSAFIVSLPIPALRTLPGQPAEEQRAAIPPMPKPALLDGLRVLVVDDDPDGREALQAVLERCGAHVTSAASAAEALAALEQAAPEVLVSDIGMPEQDGYHLIREIRKRSPDRGGRIPAIALTAYAAAEDREKTLNAGFQAHLAKPAEPVELVAKVAILAGRGGITGFTR